MGYTLEREMAICAARFVRDLGAPDLRLSSPQPVLLGIYR